MSGVVIFSKTYKNKKIAFCRGYSYYLKSVSKSDPEVSFFSFTGYWNEDIKFVSNDITILIYCLTYAALRRFPAVAVHQTLAKALINPTKSNDIF